MPHSSESHDHGRDRNTKSGFLSLVEAVAMHLVPRGFYRRRLLRWVDRAHARALARQRATPPD